MMNALYSWLQDAVSVRDLTDYLYWFDLKPSQNAREHLNEVYRSVHTLVEGFDMSATLNHYEITVLTKRLDTPNIHANYNVSTKAITLNETWVASYRNIIGKELAEALHLAHEVYHVIESDTMWYQGLKYRERHAMSEVSAIYFSQCVSGFTMHPRIVEFATALNEGKYTKNELVSYLKERVHEYEVY